MDKAVFTGTPEQVAKLLQEYLEEIRHFRDMKVGIVVEITNNIFEAK